MNKHLQNILVALALCVSVASCVFSFSAWQSLHKSEAEVKRLNSTVVALMKQVDRVTVNTSTAAPSDDIIADNFVSVSTDDKTHAQGTNFIPKLNDCIKKYYSTDVKADFAYLGYYDDTFVYHLRGSDALVEVQNNKVVKIENISDDKAPVLIHRGFMVPRIEEVYKKCYELDKSSIYDIIKPKTDNPDSYTLVNLKTGEKSTIRLE